MMFPEHTRVRVIVLFSTLCVLFAVMPAAAQEMEVIRPVHQDISPPLSELIKIMKTGPGRFSPGDSGPPRRSAAGGAGHRHDAAAHGSSIA
jgi:hypothetical protein